MRWSEICGLSPIYVLPDYIEGDALDIQWKLYEFGGHFYRGRPKDGSIRPADLPSFLAELLAVHMTQIKGRRCTCRKFDQSTGPASGTTWCTGAEYTFLSPGGGHYRRSTYGGRYFHPAADGWYPEWAHQSARAVLIDTGAPFPGLPLMAWPAAVPGEEFAPPTGRGVARFVSDPETARCAVCRRAFPRLGDVDDSHLRTGQRERVPTRTAKARRIGVGGGLDCGDWPAPTRGFHEVVLAGRASLGGMIGSRLAPKFGHPDGTLAADSQTNAP